MRVIVNKQPEGPPPKPSERYDPIEIKSVPVPNPLKGTVLVKLRAAALNHRDVYIREGQYPAIKFGSTLAADGAGDVVAVGEGVEESLVGRKVYINTSVGWESNPRVPEDPRKYGVLGHWPLPGTLAEYILVPRSVVFDLPAHLTYEEGAAIPLAGLTAWRALVTLGEAKKGDKILIPGIGGGVALFALQFAVGIGCEVWVTSGSEEKLARAIKLGAKGAVNYKNANWVAELEKKSGGNFDAVIDGSSGPNTKQFLRLIKGGGIISVYGAVAGSNVTITMPYIWFKSAQIRGSNMGNNAEFRAMTKFIAETKLKPEVSGVWDGLENAEHAYQEMRAGKQFGKLVVRIKHADSRL
ncbi:NAD(P)-binding protein [Gonapodya prolifera JEL478]|uniref:NAD(P)-binding protein n=1 Tax=Gonapodya prolifera (strain JEL478) TaxID=1344416 RepID=A0A139A3F8_GONPJ|nr:NAD(P)-binding protein [Gonapodya prolifera JEL478]|eukprot:KXS11332.1 NAD(P)-binding protein [Gonapodya prolifera JEL478]